MHHRGNESVYETVAVFPKNIKYKVIITVGGVGGSVGGVLEEGSRVPERKSCSGFHPKAQSTPQLCDKRRNMDTDGFRNDLLF